MSRDIRLTWFLLKFKAFCWARQLKQFNDPKYKQKWIENFLKEMQE